jgi:hypothetical protein
MVAITPPYWHKNDVVAICFVALDLKSSSRLSGCLLGFRVSSWLLPRTTFGAATALIYFACLLSFPTWGLMWMG